MGDQGYGLPGVRLDYRVRHIGEEVEQHLVRPVGELEPRVGEDPRKVDLIEPPTPWLRLVSQEVEEIPAGYRGDLMRLRGCRCRECRI